jgi:hypothetical protein
VFDIFNGVLGDLYQVIISAMVVLGVLFVAHTWSKSRSLVPTLGAVIFSAIIVWGAANIQYLTGRVNSDVGDYDADDTPGSGVPQPPTRGG